MTKSLEIYRSTRTTVIKAGRVSSHRGSLPFLRYLHKFHPQYLSAFDEKAIQGEELYQKLMLDKLEVNAGMLVENIVAQMFVASGHKLYFYSNNSRTDASERMEIDFLIEKPTITNAHNIFPIESNRATTTPSHLCRSSSRSSIANLPRLSSYTIRITKKRMASLICQYTWCPCYRTLK